MIFDYDAHGKHIATLNPLRGESGQLIVKLLTIEALGKTEEHLLVAGITNQGRLLPDDDAEKLLRLPVKIVDHCGVIESLPALVQDLQQREEQTLRETNQRNLQYFEQEVEKLEGWADDLKNGLEQEIKEIDKQIKETRKAAAVAATLEEKLKYQKQQRDMESRRSRLRKELYEKQDEVETQRNELIGALENCLQQQITELRPCNYTVNANDPPRNYRETVQEVGKIKQMLFGGFEKCLYPLQKFDSDTERRFSILLERDAEKWFKPVKGQFQLYYKLGSEQPEYVPDFVVEMSDKILMCETKARTDLQAADVQAKAKAAALWCQHASQHNAAIGGKPWHYLLIPHDEIAENKQVSYFMRFERKP